MPNVANDPSALLFTCERCGHWPMAYQAHHPARREVRFACPRCHAHAGFSARRAVLTAAVADSGSIQAAE